MRAMRPSRRKRSRTLPSRANSRCSTLSAARAPSRPVAANTTAMPPRPSSESSFHAGLRAVPTRALASASIRSDSDAAAVGAVVAFGEDAVPALRARLPLADPAEKRALDEALARLGGKDAFSALLSGLDSDDVDAAKAATLTVRQRVKDADTRERRSY